MFRAHNASYRCRVINYSMMIIIVTQGVVSVMENVPYLESLDLRKNPICVSECRGCLQIFSAVVTTTTTTTTIFLEV